MADNKDFQIGNKAKDLLVYSINVTKPISDKSMETKDVLSTMLKLKDMPPDEVQAFCNSAADKFRRSVDKQGYPKSTVHSYIKIIRETALGIVTNIQMANDCRFETEYDKRLNLIDEVLRGCNLMLQLIEISLELNYINIKRCKHWTKLVTDVKYMTLSWKKKDSGRAEELRKTERTAEFNRQAQILAEAIKMAKG